MSNDSSQVLGIAELSNATGPISSPYNNPTNTKDWDRIIYSQRWNSTSRKHQNYVHVKGQYQSNSQKNKALFETWKS